MCTIRRGFVIEASYSPTPAESPVVAVVTPSLDQGAYVGDAIASVDLQRVVPIEHVVVDGGSHDETLAILRERTRRGGFRFVSEPDAGQADAVNKGVRMTIAPIVGWLNADDRYAPGAVAAVVAAFGDESCEVVFGDAEEISGDGAVVRPLRATSFRPRDLLVRRFTLYQPAFFFRRSALERLGPLRVDLHYVLDYELILRASLRCRVVQLHTVLAQHRVHSGAKSARDANAFFAEYLRVLDDLYADPSLREDLRALRGEAYRIAYLDGAERALDTGDRRAARARALEALRAHPAVDARSLRAVLLALEATTGLALGRSTLAGLRRSAHR
jgi:glycosyltransferase involved in cell wall biosynthesis